jgi:putative solute:sodium symporter small subunit
MATLPPTPPATPERPHVPAQRHYWQRTRRLTLLLLLAWFVTTAGSIFFARELSHFTLLGWPFSYYMVAQGTTLLYLAIVGLYAWRLRWLDRRYHAEVQDGR